MSRDLPESAHVDQSPNEHTVACVWGIVLGSPCVDTEENFFLCGGDSLLAIRLIACIEEEWGIRLPLQAVFEAPTIRGLLDVVAAAWETSRRNRGQMGGRATSPPGDGTLEIHWRASLQQEHLIRRLGEAQSGSWVIAAQYRLQGNLDVERLERALGRVAAHHPALRMSLRRDEDAVYQVVHPDSRVILKRWRPADIDIAAATAAADNWVGAQASMPFDLRTAPLARAGLAEISHQHYVLFLAISHVVCDAWSFQLVLRDLALAYTADGTVDLPLVGISPGEWAQAQRDYLSAETGDRAVEYWRRYLGNDPSVLRFRLPNFVAMPRTSPAGTPSSRRVPADSESMLRRFAHTQGVTIFAIVAAALATWVAAATGHHRCAIRTTSANRKTIEDHGLVEWMAHDLYLVLNVAEDDSFSGLARQAQNAVASGIAHGGLSDWYVYEQVWPQHPEEPNTPTLYLVVNRPWFTDLKLEGVNVEPIHQPPGNMHGLWIWGVDYGDFLDLRFEYRKGSFAPNIISTLSQEVASILAAGTAEPACRLGFLMEQKNI